MQTHLGNGSIQVLSILRALTPPSEAESVKTNEQGISPVVQWLRLHASNAGGMGSIPGQGTKIPHIVWLGEKSKKKINKRRRKGRRGAGLNQMDKWKSTFQAEETIGTKTQRQDNVLLSEKSPSSQDC